MKEDVKVTVLVSAPALNIDCDTLFEAMCELRRASGLEKGIIEDDNPTET